MEDDDALDLDLDLDFDFDFDLCFPIFLLHKNEKIVRLNSDLSERANEVRGVASGSPVFGLWFVLWLGWVVACVCGV